MGINIMQFAPPGKVSKLVWDEDMEAGAGKIFKGDLTGDVITTYRMTPKTPYSYTQFVAGNTTGERDNMVLYNVMPNQLLTGTINAYRTGGDGVSMYCLDKSWNVLSAAEITTDATDYTLPAGTNCIVLALRGSNAIVYIAQFDIEAV